MGFFGSLAKKVGGGISTLGKKVGDGVRAGVKYGITHSEKIGQIAGKVSNVAEKVGDAALLGAGVLGSVAGASKGVMKGADAVQGVANKVTKAKQTASRFGIDANAMANKFLG